MKRINLKSTSLSTAAANDIVLRESNTTRLIFRPLIVDNSQDPQASVKGWFIFQKKNITGNWADYNDFPLSRLKNEEWIKLELKSAEIKILLDNLPIIKRIYDEYGIILGESSFEITEGNISEVILQLSKLNNKELIVQELEKLNPDDFENLSESLLFGLHVLERKKAITVFEQMLANDLVEQKWQEWFQKNYWVLGTEFVQVLDERAIDTKNITDYLMKAYDGFLDIVEIKRPEGKMTFWAKEKDHDNLIPSPQLVKAIIQATKYIYEVERESNSIKFLERVGSVKTIKPRCILIFGRSNNWETEHCEAYRILNSSYHNLTIMTYDHVLERAKRILGVQVINTKADEDIDFDDIPF